MRLIGHKRYLGGAKVKRAKAPVKITRADGSVEVIPGDSRTYRQRRDASRSNRYRVTAKMKQAVFERDDGKCRICGTARGPFHVDHIRPYSKGGWNVLSNLQLLCRDCNLAKGAVWTRAEAPTESERFRY